MLLWKYHLPSVNTIVRIIYTEPDVTHDMKMYQEKLEKAGADVVEWIPAGNMDCPLKSQLIRYLIHSIIEGVIAGTYSFRASHPSKFQEPLTFSASDTKDTLLYFQIVCL